MFHKTSPINSSTKITGFDYYYNQTVDENVIIVKLKLLITFI